jgi:hypothetical protein
MRMKIESDGSHQIGNACYVSAAVSHDLTYPLHSGYAAAEAAEPY